MIFSITIDDQGVISGVQEMEDFKTRFALDDGGQVGFMVAILELGAWAGSWIIGYFADKIGRKHSIVLSTLIFLLGMELVHLYRELAVQFVFLDRHISVIRCFFMWVE